MKESALRRIVRQVQRLLLGALVATALSALAPAFAEVEPKREIPPGYEPIKGAEARAQSVDANALVVGAYGAILVLMCGFVVYVARTQSAISKEMVELAGKLDKADGR